MKRWDVLGFGAVAVDDLLYLDRYPQADEKMQILGKARDGGGMAGTALVTAAKLGASAAWAGVLGFDDLSIWTLDAFAGARVDTSPVVRFGAAHPIHSIVLVERAGGTRTILYSWDGVQQLTPDEVTPDMIADAGVVFLDHTIGELSSHILALTKQAGVPTVADLERLDPGVAESVREVEHLIVGRKFAAQATGEKDPAAAVRALAALRRDLPLTAVTADGEGYWWIERGDPQIRHRPALAVDVIDTTGCGDVFHGAYAAELAHGAPVARALEIANVAAGLKATQHGGRHGIPTRADVETRRSEEYANS
jgi:sulfofructose kinase